MYVRLDFYKTKMSSCIYVYNNSCPRKLNHENEFSIEANGFGILIHYH